jgi:hypothetical protein
MYIAPSYALGPALSLTNSKGAKNAKDACTQ